MRSIFSSICIIGCILFTGMIAGCEKNASDANFGSPKVYMPQAQIAALRYNVPNTGIGLDSVTKNFQVTADSVKIILGISRSGTEQSAGYAAEVFVNADTVNQLLANAVFPPASSLLLPADTYSLPASVNVSEGRTGNTFYLTINRQKLKAYAGKTVLLAVGVKNPTLYQLNNAINKVIVVINVSALNL